MQTVTPHTVLQACLRTTLGYECGQPVRGLAISYFPPQVCIEWMHHALTCSTADQRTTSQLTTNHTGTGDAPEMAGISCTQSLTQPCGFKQAGPGQATVTRHTKCVSSSHPVAGSAQDLQQLLLLRAGGGHHVVPEGGGIIEDNVTFIFGDKVKCARLHGMCKLLFTHTSVFTSRPRPTRVHTRT